MKATRAPITVSSRASTPLPPQSVCSWPSDCCVCPAHQCQCDRVSSAVDTDPLGLADPFGLGRRDSIATAQGHEALLRVTEALNGGQCCRTSETDLPARSSWRRGSCSSQTHRYSSTSIGSRVSSATQPGEQTRAFRIASRARARARWGATQPKLREASSIMRGLKLPPPVGLAVEAYRMQPLVPLVRAFTGSLRTSQRTHPL
jgi:hypothetical protein